MANKTDIIESEINKLYTEYYSAVYSGKLEVPANFITLFGKGIMALPPFGHKINFHKIKSILTVSSVSKLRNSEISEIIKIIVNTPPSALFDSIDECVKEMVKIQNFILEFNQMAEDLDKGLNEKRMRMRAIALGTEQARPTSSSIITM